MAIEKFPIGRGATLRELQEDPHPLLARLRAAEPVSWLAVRGGWLVTRYDLAVGVMRDPTTFTVDDPRFSTSQVLGASMLSLDGADHARHREPFAHQTVSSSREAGIPRRSATLSPWSGSVERSPVRFSRSSKSRERVHIPQAPSKNKTPDMCPLSMGARCAVQRGATSAIAWSRERSEVIVAPLLPA